MHYKNTSIKPVLFIILGILSICSQCSDKPTIEELKKFAATETYPDDTFFDTATNKKALIVVAHDDDDCAMSGTIAKLTAQGWRIKQISFTEHKAHAGIEKHPATFICEGNEPLLEDRLYRRGLDTMKTPYLPIPKADMEKQFLRDKITKALIDKVNNFKPSVIFTLDNEKGGYGHPEHIYISQLVLDLFKADTLTVQRIYQSVYTNHMEKEIVDTWLKAKMEKWKHPHASTIANELYGIDGMPEPTVQVNIKNYADAKMAYLRAYDEDVRQNLRKFIPYYEEFDTKTYFEIFDREFFRVIE